jgi:hypothetical protein
MIPQIPPASARRAPEAGPPPSPAAATPPPDNPLKSQGKGAAVRGRRFLRTPGPPALRGFLISQHESLISPPHDQGTDPNPGLGGALRNPWDFICW